MRTRALAFALAVAVAAACDGGGGPSGVDEASVPGTYTGRHIFTITISGQTFPGFQCNGTILITSAQGGTISGTFTLDPEPDEDCQEAAGAAIFTGTVASNGNLTITFPDLQDFVEGFEELGCTVTRADQAFAGTLRSGRIQARFTATVICPEITGPDPVGIVWDVDMTKSS